MTSQRREAGFWCVSWVESQMGSKSWGYNIFRLDLTRFFKKSWPARYRPQKHGRSECDYRGYNRITCWSISLSCRTEIRSFVSRSEALSVIVFGKACRMGNIPEMMKEWFKSRTRALEDFRVRYKRRTDDCRTISAKPKPSEDVIYGHVLLMIACSAAPLDRRPASERRHAAAYFASVCVHRFH